ncbi:MAG: MCP four helix bundle domain-containing protein [Clostridiales bacterium]|nr:MCP four helix bundle domain-containing protein [Clostridiales bacterium]
MKWYKNLKIRLKFIICFGIISILVFLLGAMGIKTINLTNNNYKTSINSNNQAVTMGIEIIEDVTNLRITAFNHVTNINANTEAKIKSDMKEAYDIAKNDMEEYLTIIKNKNIGGSRDQEIEIVNSIIKSLDEYYNGFLKYVDATVEGDDERVQQLDEQLTVIGNTFFKNTYEAPLKAFESLFNDVTKTEEQSSIEIIQFLIVFIIIQLFVILFGIRLSIDIRKPIEKLKFIALNVAKGNLQSNCRTNVTDEIGELSNAIADMSETFQYIIDDINDLSNQLDKGNISYRINSNRYEGSFKEATNAINIATNNLVEDSLYVIDRIKDFGDGNFDANVKDFAGEKAVIKEGIVAVQDALKSVSNDISNLIEAANEGNLEFRLNTYNYVGQWKDTIDGLNHFVENVVVPIKETQNALNQFSLGNFSHRITNEYKGEFNNIKQTVNYTAETIDSYITEISNILNEMANKNFDISIDRNYLGDFEQIKESVNLIVKNLNVLTKDIIRSAEQVSVGSKQISESSVSLAEGATEQAGSVEELNATINMISKQSRDNVNSSEKASELALQAKNSANDGSKQMDNMLLAMEEINDASNSISNIIKVIDDIAFQTNILALNAAVEAARAGEHGKGFAVVAEEVRSLAARSQQAAKETTDLIESSVTKVSEGSKIANNTAESLVNIVKQIEEISNLTSSCAKSSKEQEVSIEQITDGIKQISIVTQNNTATSEESAAAAEELASQAQVFYASVSDFKLKSDI